MKFGINTKFLFVFDKLTVVGNEGKELAIASSDGIEWESSSYHFSKIALLLIFLLRVCLLTQKLIFPLHGMVSLLLVRICMPCSVNSPSRVLAKA